MRDSLYNYRDECIDEPLELNDDWKDDYEDKEDSSYEDYDVRDSDFI